ncbi:MAG: fused response regulator/phosphatase [Telmatospirillum sp.]|nr:fused response regulator/phosphatase [Telmatospirillum sp.]
MFDEDVTFETEPGTESGVDLSACRVLLLLEGVETRARVTALLSAAGVGTVDVAGDAAGALGLIADHEPDLVLLDIDLPGLDGPGFCRRVRTDAGRRLLPILAVTGDGGTPRRSAIFRAGASDLVTRPVHGPEFVARVRNLLENRRLVRTLEDHVRLMRWELDLARVMQEHLLPTPESLEKIRLSSGLWIQSHFQPSSELGGDLWSVRSFADGRAMIALFDFSGHGLSAALNTFRLHALMSEIPPDPDDPAGYLAVLNGRLVDLLPRGQFATMILVVVDNRLGHLTFSAAGAPTPVIANPAVDRLDSSGLPLGVSHAARYDNQRCPFPEGASLFLYSDALIESPDGAGRCLSPHDLDGVPARLRGAGDDGLRVLVTEFLADRPVVADDLTLIWLHRRPAA